MVAVQGTLRLQRQSTTVLLERAGEEARSRLRFTWPTQVSAAQLDGRSSHSDVRVTCARAPVTHVLTCIMLICAPIRDGTASFPAPLV